MVDRNTDVMEMVEEALRENPDISNKDLKLKAEEIDDGIEELSARQFNARYPLQVKRQLSVETAVSADGGAPSSVKATVEGDEFREELRETLIAFARDVAGADDRGAVIDVLTDVDEYVDRVMDKA